MLLGVQRASSAALKLRNPTTWTTLVHMRSTSLVSAKMHLSELVDEAEHRGKRILILRHGKPAAAIVPVEVAIPPKPKAKPMTDEEIAEMFARFASTSDPD